MIGASNRFLPNFDGCDRRLPGAFERRRLHGAAATLLQFSGRALAIGLSRCSESSLYAKRSRRGLSVIVASVALLLGAFGQAFAAVSCTVTPFSGSFGVANILPGTAINSTGSTTVTCSGGTSNQAVRLCLEIGAGTTALGPSNERVMRSSSDYLNTEFYFDAGRTQLWGSWGIGGSSAYPVASPAGIQNDVTLNTSGAGTFAYTVYASILSGQSTHTPGNYSWTGISPTVQYLKKAGASNCPTGGNSSNASGSTFTATVNATCNVSAANINFGSAGVLSANINSTGTVTPQCTNSTPYNIGLNAGTATGATVTTRKMTNGAATVAYRLYSNSGRTTNWGNTVGTDTVGGAGTGNNQSYTVYGRVPAQTTPAPAAYTDTIVVTVTY